MQIILNIDGSLLNKALELTDLTTQEDLIKLTLQEFNTDQIPSSGKLPKS